MALSMRASLLLVMALVGSLRQTTRIWLVWVRIM